MSKTEKWDGLYSNPMPSRRVGPIYNAFSYPTKIDAEAIALFIATHTEPGATVLDVFGGSGSTGIAARLCDRPTRRMGQLAEELGVRPAWGPRKAVVYELSPLGALLGDVMSNPPDPAKFETAARSVADAASREFGWMYEAESPNGSDGEMRYAIWSEVLITPCCQARVSLWDAAASRNPARLASEFECHRCQTIMAVGECERSTSVHEDPLTGIESVKRERVLVQVYGRSGRQTWSREAGNDDRALAEKSAVAELGFVPRGEIFWGDLYRSGYHTGIERYHQLYTPRNLRAVSALWSLVDQHPVELQSALRLWILSYNASHSTLLTRVVAKKNQSDFAITGAQSGVLYVSGLPVEKNVFHGVTRKIATFQSAFELTHSSASEVLVVCGSSSSLDIPDSSVDYVFTDPPFGDFIPYSEVNQVNEAWLDQFTDRTDEAIVSPGQQKGVADYEILLTEIFGEIRRVLKSDGLLTVVFHASKPAIWDAVANSFRRNGLTPVLTSVLDKAQASFKQVVSSGGTRGDALFLLKRADDSVRESAMQREGDLGRIVDDIVSNAADDPVTPRRVYSRYVARCVELDTKVEMTAPQFYRWFENHFVTSGSSASSHK